MLKAIEEQMKREKFEVMNFDDYCALGNTVSRLRSELAALKAELREICAAIDDPACDLTLTAVECIKKLKAENEALRKDAERWRLLRKTMEESVGGGVLVNDEKLVYEDPEAGEAVSIYWYPDTPVGFYESKADTLDEAIDAMAKGEKG